jgi:uncharacterized Zn-binding protein involved in type VI secretion
MANEAAKEGDTIKGDPLKAVHKWTNSSNLPVSPHACTFEASINKKVSADVFINSKAAATVGSVADAGSEPEPPATVPGTADPKASATGTISAGSKTVSINSKGAARNGDGATACREASVVVSGTANVFIGG